MKVSVFNDDRKTELIGETWIALDKVIVPGGGQNDVWHNLNCKGRYAGEIRIELTYYDTRAKEEKTVETRREASLSGIPDRGKDGIVGPRQPKAVKRRPLPTDPTGSWPIRPPMPEHAQSAPLPYIPPRTVQVQNQPLVPLGHQPNEHSPQALPQLDRRYQHASVTDAQDVGFNGYEEGNSHHRNEAAPEPLQQPSPQYNGYGHSSNDGNLIDGADQYPNHHEIVAPQHLPGRKRQSDYKDYTAQGQIDESYYANDLPAIPPTQRHQSRQPAQRVPPSGMVHSHSSPAFPTQHRNSLPDVRQERYSQGPAYAHSKARAHHESYDEHDSAYLPSRNDRESRSSPLRASVEDDEAPPPPPAHRNSGQSAVLPTYQPSDAIISQRGPIPIPLKVRHSRASISASPLSQVQSNVVRNEYELSSSPSNSQGFLHLGPTASSQTSYSQPARRPSQDPTMTSPLREYSQPIPPTLVPGYDPRTAEEESQRMLHKKRMSARQIVSNGISSEHSQPPTYVAHSQAQQNVQAAPRQMEDPRVHRSSVPTTKTRAVSPGVRTPIRKSVSPQPGSAPGERHLSGVPFSPDSYDSFNPNLSAAASINTPGPKYTTPEQAKVASLQRNREADGPIIGADGREIDPSDHLPIDTWAPEPERKNLRKGPEVTLRFRHSPQGAQPMPLSTPRAPRDGVGRPMPNPIYTQLPNPTTPLSGGRNRLQKKSRVSPTQPMPNANFSTPPMVNPDPRVSPSDYPLRERESPNYGYGSSPTYARGTSGPPLVPSKVPIARGQEDWSTDPLSEEMRRIDIGVGGGGRQRRSRFGL